ncbi:aminotransferase class I/II-fold pyridoxal phosphate-dependent enzyme, partial [Thermodesulfobacteriota bacterium]
QFIYTIPRALETRRALILGPTYADYADACFMHNVSYDFLLARKSDAFTPDMDVFQERIQDYDTVFICNPNNPTGTLIPAAGLEQICKTHPGKYFIIDESYLPFADGSGKESLMRRDLPNTVVLNSMSKFFRIPGLRIGFLIASPAIVEKFRTFSLPWNVNGLAQIAVKYLMNRTEEINGFVENTLNFFEKEKDLLLRRFEDFSHINFFPSTTSFLLARLYGDLAADRVSEILARDRILIRNCANFTGLSDRFIRISLQSSEINEMVSEKLLSLPWASRK